MIVVCFGGIDPANIPHNGRPAFVDSHYAACVGQQEINRPKTADPSPCYHPGERLEALCKVPGSHPV